MAKRIVVAIDGPAGAGKSTIARSLAGKLGFLYLDTGAMYRAVALQALSDGVDVSDTAGLERVAEKIDLRIDPESLRIFANGLDVTETIRQEPVSQAASRVSTVPGVRRAMVRQQRRLAENRSVVLEGRDIGTVVFPDAEVKIFLDADPSIRADRRTRELQDKGQEVSTSEIGRDISERDTRDRTRADSPLLQAPDASYLDTTHLTRDEVEAQVLKLIRDRLSNGKEVQR